jgi:hypothetical protein
MMQILSKHRSLLCNACMMNNFCQAGVVYGPILAAQLLLVLPTSGQALTAGIVRGFKESHCSPVSSSTADIMIPSTSVLL